MPPPGCSPMAPRASTRRCISSGAMSSEVSVTGFVSQRPYVVEPWSDLGTLEALWAGLVEASAGDVFGQVLLCPSPRIVVGVVVTVAIVAAVAQAAHQAGDGVAQVERHGVVARLAHCFPCRAVGPPHRLRR